MDADTAKATGIHIYSAVGNIQFASRSHFMPRIGTTPPITFTPILVADTLTPLSPVTHSFELLDLPTDEY